MCITYNLLSIVHCIVGRLTNVTPFAFILWIVFEEELLEVGEIGRAHV